MNVGDALARARKALTEAGIDSAALDARLLVAAALGVSVERVIAWPEQEVAAEAAGRLEALLRRRVAREPMAQILGHREFWSLDFAVTRDVLTPRPDSETLIQAVLDQSPDRTRALAILDLGVGSGCLLLTLLRELPHARGVGVDASAAALGVAQQNAERLGLAGRVRLVHGDWLADVRERFDVIVGNPPYIRTRDLEQLAPELKYEPRAALDGGADGLAAYRAIAPELHRALAPGGFACVEIGHDQAADVAAILRAAGLDAYRRDTDLSGRDRCLSARPAR